MVLPDGSVVNSFCSTAAISCRGMDESLMLFWEEEEEGEGRRGRGGGGGEEGEGRRGRGGGGEDTR